MIEDDIFKIDDDELDPFQLKRKRRVRSLREMLQKCKKISLKEFVAKVSINCGIHEKTVRRYLESLEISGEIKISDGTISLVED